MTDLSMNFKILFAEFKVDDYKFYT